MVARIIDGKAIAEKVRKEIKQKVAILKSKPGLAVIRVGNDEASKVYVRSKIKACEEVGFYSESHELKEDTKLEDVMKLIDELNKKKNIHGILLQLPLPKHLDENKLINKIIPSKDVDGLHPVSLGKLVLGDYFLASCTPMGIIKLIESTGERIEGKHAVVVGRSKMVGKPVALLLLDRNATVTICHSKTKDLGSITKQADILVAAVGKTHLIKKDMVKKGAIVIDVGINRMEGKLIGDVDFDNVKEVAGYITPVPGGVGPMTIAMLLENTLKAMEESK